MPQYKQDVEYRPNHQIKAASRKTLFRRLNEMECAGCKREAKFMVLYPNNPEPHCQYCLMDAVESTVPVPVQSVEVYERLKGAKKNELPYAI